MSTSPQTGLRVSGSGRSPDGHSISFSGLTELEQERLEGVLAGQWWVRGSDGRLQFAPAREPSPDPTEDDMLPQWRRSRKDDAAVGCQTQQFEEIEMRHLSPSISIQHLCGYNYTPEGYRANAALLENCGFACMRSRRGDDGRFWEIWFLPGLFMAQGRLKEALSGKQKEHHLRFALRFLSRNVSFGTLDISVQRMCQRLAD